jgi:excinuclease ABC subunit A
MGPEGGSGGGTVVTAGTPEDVVKVKASHTGQFLKHMLESRPVTPAKKARKRAPAKPAARSRARATSR